MSNDYTDDETAAGFDPDNVPDQAGAAPHAPTADGDEEFVLVYPAEGRVAETAKALNDAAAGREHTVQWTGEGAFRVPASVADAADYGDADVVRVQPQSSSSPTQHTDGSGNVAPAGGNAPAIAETEDSIDPLAEDVSTVPEHPDSRKQEGTVQQRGGDPDGDGQPNPARAEAEQDNRSDADGDGPNPDADGGTGQATAGTSPKAAQKTADAGAKPGRASRARGGKATDKADGPAD